MQLNHSNNLFTADGTCLGQIDRVVIDPKTESITHLIIRKGGLFDEDKIVSIELIAAEHTDQIALRAETQQTILPDFEKSPASLPGDQPTGGDNASAFYWYPPLRASMLPMLNYFQSAYLDETQVNIPPDTVAITEGTQVVSSDGQPLGHIAKVLTSFSENRVTHFLLASQAKPVDQKLIPVDWIDRWSADELYLRVGSMLIEILPIYKPAQPAVEGATIPAKKKNRTATRSRAAKPITKRKRPAQRVVKKIKH